jgi:TPR repeat protein
MTNLGRLYENGHGVAKDYIKAREWYEKAAREGDGSATAYLKKLSIREAAGARSRALLPDDLAIGTNRARALVVS